MSIFNSKECPLCNRTIAETEAHCTCGYSFDPSRAEEVAQDLLICAEEEKLYEQYLAARVEQAQEVYQIAEAVYTQDNDTSENLSKAREGLEKAKEELFAQSKIIIKTRQTTQRAKVLVSKTTPTTTHARNTSIIPPQSAPIVINRSIKKSVTGKEDSKSNIRAKAIRKIESLIFKKKEKTVKPEDIKITGRIASSGRVNKQIKSDKAHQRGKPSRKASTKVSVKPAAKILTSTETIKKTALPVTRKKQSTITSTPDHSFRAAQSAKASAIMKLAMKVIEAGNIRKDYSKQKSASFSEKKTYEPEKLIRKDKFVCPHCTATLDTNTIRCGCGYQISSASTEVSGLALNDMDRALLDDPASIQITKFG